MEALIILFLVGIVSIVPEFLFPEEDPNYEKFLKSPKCPKIIFGKYREYGFPNNCPALQKIRERDEHAKAEYEKWLKEKNVITDKQEVANND